MVYGANDAKHFPYSLSSMNTIYDTILWLQATTGMRQFPIVQFSGDTDMVTQGWISLSSIERPEIVVTKLTGAEYENTYEGPGGYLQVEHRVNGALDRSDLRSSWVVRVEHPEKVATGNSFAVFGCGRLPNKLFYRDIFSNDSLAEVVGQVPLSEFEDEGGKLIVLE